MSNIAQAHDALLGATEPAKSANPLAPIRRWIGEQRTVSQLSALTDRQLNDIGVERAEIREVARRACR